MRTHKRTITNFIILISVLITTISCQENIFYHSYQPVNNTGWERDDTFLYQLPASIHCSEYEYELGIRHKDSYKYRDIWLTVNEDTLHLFLADSIGYWKGNGIGEIRQCTHRFTIPSQDSIQEIRINHIMQDNPLVGIHDIGIQIKKLP